MDYLIKKQKENNRCYFNNKQCLLKMLRFQNLRLIISGIKND